MRDGILRFADFELDRNVYELRRNGNPLKLERIPLDLLFLLVDQRNRLVTREEIFERIWGKGVFLDTDNAINSAVRKLRRALGDDPDAPRFVVTVPSKGYRFIADVCEESLAAANPPSSTQSEAATPKKSDEPQIRRADTSAPENLEGERKTVTVLLVDFKGSAGLVEDLDPEETRAIFDPAMKLMIDAVHHYDGYVTRSTDDGIFAMFGAPIAHEDHPQRALSAALQIQAELKRYGEKLRAEKGVQMQVRAGAHTGEVVVREIRTGEKHTEYGPIGHSTSVAAHLQMMAAPGSIAITESTRKLVEGYFTLKPLGPTRINGVSEALEIYEVTGPGPLRTHFQRAAARGYTKFVGRQREMETLKHAAELAQAGRGQIVATVAEPGLGKSRLFFEFKAKGQSGWMVLEAFSVSHGKASAYLPLLDLLHTYFKLASDEDARSRREKVAGKITVLDRSLEDALPYLFALLGIVEGKDPLAQMDANLRKRRTLDSIKRILLRESLNQPLIVIFEDLHWIDEQTQEFLSLLAESLANAKLLLLVNYRPEYSHQWGSKTYYTQLRLDPLGAESADEMLSALLGDSLDLAPVKKLIIERTEGNPFFIEEIVQALFEQEALVRDGAVKLAKSLSSIQIPPSVQAVLTSRIDRLAPGVKDLLNMLAVIGKEFPLGLVTHMAGKPDDELQQMLMVLQAAEFIYEQPAFPDVSYAFKHALSQQVAYGSTLQERRKVLHERIAKVLEEHFPETVETQPELIGHHYTQAGLGTEAIPYWQRAGERALQRAANAEAISHLTRGLELLNPVLETPERSGQKPADEGRHCALLLALGEAQKGVGAHLDAQETLVHAADIAQLLGSTELLVRAALDLAEMSSEFGFPAAPPVRLLENASYALGVDDRPLKVETLIGLAQALVATGVHQKAMDYALEVVAMARRLDKPELLAEGLVAALAAFQGPEHAEQRLAYATELLRLAGAPDAQLMRRYERLINYGQFWLLYSFLELGDMPATDAAIDAFGRWCERAQEPLGTSLHIGFRAMRALMRGHFTDSERLTQEASAIGQRVQTENAAGFFALQMFSLRREQGRLKELEPVVRYFVQQNTAAAAWRPGLALIYGELGRRPEALEQFEHLAQHDFADLPRDGLWMASMLYLTDVCTFLEDRARAATLYQLLLPYAGRNAVIGIAAACYGALSRYLGALATTLERWHEAEQHFEDAMAMNARMGARPWLAHTQYQYATMLLLAGRSGDRNRAAELFHSALLTARELGMRALEERLNEKMTP